MARRFRSEHDVLVEVERRLRDAGFYVHRHSYDYIVMKDGRMVCTVHAYPWEKRFVVVKYVLNEEAEKQCGIVYSIIEDVGVEVEVREGARLRLGS